MKLTIDNEIKQQNNRSKTQSPCEANFGMEEKMANSDTECSSYDHSIGMHPSMTLYLSPGEAGSVNEGSTSHNVTTNESLREQLALEKQREREKPQEIFAMSMSNNDHINPVPQIPINKTIITVTMCTSNFFHHPNMPEKAQNQHQPYVYSIPSDFPHFDEFNEESSKNDKTNEQRADNNQDAKEEKHERKACCVIF